MTRHYCISARPEALDRWRQAFPDGVVCPDTRPLSGQVGDGDVLWLVLPPAGGSPADVAVRTLTTFFPQCTTVAMSNMPGQQEALLVFNAGAKAYCHALSNAETLRQIAVVVSHGGVWVGQDLLTRVVKAAEHAFVRERSPANSSALDQLSSRERAVALEVAKGATNKEIARRLSITERTVKAHLGSVFAKLNVRDRLQLVLVLNSPGELIGHAA